MLFLPVLLKISISLTDAKIAFKHLVPEAVTLSFDVIKN